MKAIELFAGAGLMGLALRDAGFEVVDAVEIDPAASEAHRRNVGPCRTMDAREYHPTEQVDLVAGGPPCQGFSDAGKRSGTTEARGLLFLTLLRVAREADAKVVWMENVPGLKSLNNRRDFDSICRIFEEHGYAVRQDVLDASMYGAPQRRKRLFIIGSKIEMPWPMLSPTHGPGRKSLVSVRAALGLRGRYAATGRTEGASGWQGVRVIDVEKPGYTVGTRDNADLLVPLDGIARDEIAQMRLRSGRRENPNGYRLNVPELAALQGFPESFEFVGTHGEKHMQVGNALPRALGVAVAAQIAMAIADAGQTTQAHLAAG